MDGVRELDIGSGIGSEIFGRGPGRPGRVESVQAMAGKFFHKAHPHTLTDIRLTLLTQIDIFWEKRVETLITR